MRKHPHHALAQSGWQLCNAWCRRLFAVEAGMCCCKHPIHPLILLHNAAKLPLDQSKLTPHTLEHLAVENILGVHASRNCCTCCMEPPNNQHFQCFPNANP